MTDFEEFYGYLKNSRFARLQHSEWKKRNLYQNKNNTSIKFYNQNASELHFKNSTKLPENVIL